MTFVDLLKELVPYEFQALADYKAERDRGIVHTPEWQAKMAAEQERFDAQARERAMAEGAIIIEARK